MLAPSRLHIDSAAACLFIDICRGGAGRVWAQGRMRHVDNHVLGGQLCVFFSYEGEWQWLAALRVTNACLLPSPYRQRSSVCMC